MSAVDQIIADNLERVRRTIDEHSAGRSVTLVCVTKYAEPRLVESLLRAGANDLGENLLPEAAERFAQLTNAGHRFTRHLIGSQQSRKLRLMPGSFDLFQAVDRFKVAAGLHEALTRTGTEMDVLLQVNISREAQKSGFRPEELDAAVDRIRSEFPTLRLRGLMSIPAGPETYTRSSEFRRHTQLAFAEVRKHFERLAASSSASTPFDLLSQGMSQDYTIALAEGASMIRIGSALFAGLQK